MGKGVCGGGGTPRAGMRPVGVCLRGYASGGGMCPMHARAYEKLGLMTFRGDVHKEGNYARRGGGGRGPMVAAGGGIGTLLIVGLFLLMGGNPGDLGGILGEQGQLPPGQNAQSGEEGGGLDHCQTGEDANKYADCRVEFTGISVNNLWEELLPAQAGIDYTPPGLVVFDGATNTGCGMAQSATGPFYCPADSTAYFDTSFFQQLRQLGGVDAPLAESYIVAHEFGHHVQNLEGTLGLSNYNDPGADSNAVKIETQADCYAGVWAHHADKGPDAMLEPITEDQVRTALATVRSVGDDNIQERSSGHVRPDQWTHGSSDMREQAFLAGYNSGKMSSCDFLERGQYRD